MTVYFFPQILNGENKVHCICISVSVCACMSVLAHFLYLMGRASSHCASVMQRTSDSLFSFCKLFQDDLEVKYRCVCSMHLPVGLTSWQESYYLFIYLLYFTLSRLEATLLLHHRTYLLLVCFSLMRFDMILKGQK